QQRDLVPRRARRLQPRQDPGRVDREACADLAQVAREADPVRGRSACVGCGGCTSLFAVTKVRDSSVFFSSDSSGSGKHKDALWFPQPEPPTRTVKAQPPKNSLRPRDLRHDPRPCRATGLVNFLRMTTPN